MRSTDLLLETIKCEDGEIHHLEYHQNRVDKSRRELFGLTETLDLASVLKAPDEKLYRCRVLYSHTVKSIEYIPYTPKEIKTLKVVPADITYDYKFADRSELDKLLKTNQDADDVIIEKNGLITDTTIANIALFDGKRWITPRKPLLEGTMRAYLIDQGFLQLRDITSDSLKSCEKVALMNAMIGFKILSHINILKS
ncbi:aminotransferase class IV family protein [Sulfurovum sp. zt1-1]|uniref:Aminotransferase class IV family protein n=1 Tax=Sulfurovum zhangzhouensis TaxID=3019067 RepID=A0ABT7QZC4_9BACT|nr:aminotransferase class IV family protein [Sulfurovum zhangzhouensis]MDM5272192.1 aminotransferase class IV family protein [Sulfurovum zhangzhouensis]